MADGTGGQTGTGTGGEGTQVAAPWGADPAQEWKVGEGEAAKSWYDLLPEGEAKALVASKKYANPVALATAYTELNRKASHVNDANMLVMPAEGAPQKDWDAFYQKQGRPPDPTGYKDVKWGENADPRMVDFGTKLAFDLGLSPPRAEMLATKWNEFINGLNAQSETEQNAQNEEAINALKTGWKGNWDTDLAAGNRVLQAMKGQGLTEEDLTAIERNVGVAPMVKMLVTLGKLSGEAGFAMTGTGGQPGDVNSMSSEQAKAEVERLNTDKDFQEAYTKAQHPGHQAAVDKMAALYLKAGSQIQM